MKGILVSVAIWLCCASGLVLATPITINFTGVQWNDPSIRNGATNFLNLSAGDVVQGSFVLDLDGLVDEKPEDPLWGIYSGLNTGPIRSFSFQSVTTVQPYLNIGRYGGYNYYNIYATGGGITVYANNLIQTPTGVTSDVFLLQLLFRPGILIDDSYDLSQIRTSDLAVRGPFGLDSDYLFMRTEDVFGNSRTVSYTGYLTDVSVAVYPIPEPSVFVLIFTVLGLLGFTKRFRKEA